MASPKNPDQTFTQAEIDLLKTRLIPSPRLSKAKTLYPTILAVAIHYELYKMALPVFHQAGV